ncbi:hypothetical protein HPQ64_18465 [Rhizobiales bacterium]|nr:hypothetical protein [Hongsoonwoonella zoysiae]NRG19678.1 hypothetical protein [Hongsoonwoonella zoysiae]
MSAQVKKSDEQGPRPELQKLYKPVGIQAITAATLCRKSVAPVKAKSSKH